MDRNNASRITRAGLDSFGLKDWSVRLTTDINAPFLGMCMHRDKAIILNAHHIDIHPDDEVNDTILHEIAHALTPGHGHDNVWAIKAREIGCTNTLPCSHLNFPEHVIDGIRSGATIEMTVTEETHIIRRPEYKVTRLQDKCPECGKVAIEKFSFDAVDKEGNLCKMITLDCFHIIKRIIPRGTPFDSMVSNDWKPEIKACKHVWDKNKCTKCLEFKMFDFQVKGALACEAGLAVQKGFGLFDDMGLGKTVQGLAIIKFGKYKRTMIVTKSAITFQWFKQAIRWLGPDYIAQVISTSRDFLFPNLKLYIISYDLLRRFPREKLHALGIELVILDECQQIKNPDSARTQEVRKLISSNPLCKVVPLSGTPWKNRGSEFFPVLNMMDPIKFHSFQNYLDTWVEYYYDGAKKKMGGIKNIKRFREYTANLLIRREYNEVMDEFPDINRMKLNVQLDELMQSTYDSSESEFAEWYNEYVIGGEEDKISGIEILAKMARMRHITGLAKIPATLSFIEEFVEETDRKLVVFVHHQDVGELMYSALTNDSKSSNPDWHELVDSLKNDGIKIFKYTSELSDVERFEMQELFNKSPRAIMIASTLACGEGVDLQTCADSVLHERQWNPQNEDQATPGRFRRIGQTSKVINITCVESEGTIDESLDAIVERKRYMFHDAMNTSTIQTWNQSDFARELAETIVAKHRAKKVKFGKTEVKTNITGKARF